MNGSSFGLGGVIFCNSVELVFFNMVIMNLMVSGVVVIEGGGGIVNVGGNIIIIDFEIFNNMVFGMFGSGGGIFNDVGVMFMVDGVEIIVNIVMCVGGGIEDNLGESMVVMFVDVILSDNIIGSVLGNGGGVYIMGFGDMDIMGGMVMGNIVVVEGGGLWNGVGFMMVINVMIDGNIVMGNSGD